ncbi:hypothetical protein SETIT_3G250800v2 [Setaria italica]|uniref:non-specific serine/threonine protein kinase n=1 Tax=Setaria italica TaxID=4555 RepID=A0A368QIM4_SETIT|nr:G-type lectin S-receptor-like serine/threonine-protein kinase At1g61370 isoform X2 [Setaria italica]RCV17825.1 hypothetical protein SETIT_3G250800v2 [Setaria italica]
MDHAASTKRDVLELMLLDESVEPTDLPLSLLEDITNNFSADKEIGRGGFAVVYKGMIRSGTIAVKKLSHTYMHEKKFHQEIECMMKVKHKNIVRFLGYCANTQGKMESFNGKLVMADVQQRLLCFEYVAKGSLRDQITDASSGLEWRQRYEIIKGICIGLNYLHRNRIVHSDLKPANILLDYDIVPKIADFGLSRCFDEKQSWAITSNIWGSLGYLPPEIHSGIITFKSDIYSLGVIIKEILTGQKVSPEDYDVIESWRDRLETSSQLEQLRVCFEIGTECTDYDPRRRPDAKQIVDRLVKAESMDRFTETDVVVQQAEMTSSGLQQGTPKILRRGSSKRSHNEKDDHEGRQVKLATVREQRKAGDPMLFRWIIAGTAAPVAYWCVLLEPKVALQPKAREIRELFCWSLAAAAAACLCVPLQPKAGEIRKLFGFCMVLTAAGYWYVLGEMRPLFGWCKSAAAVTAYCCMLQLFRGAPAYLKTAPDHVAEWLLRLRLLLLKTVWQNVSSV